MRAFAPTLLLAVTIACTAEDLGFGSASEAASTPKVGVTHALVKVRDDFAVPPTTTIELDAAQNEYEPFQIVVRGGDSIGVQDLKVTKSSLTHESGSSTLDAKHIRLHQVGRVNVKYASSAEGGSGYWPDPLIPDVDAYAHQPRNAFVGFHVAAKQSRAVWVDVFVPPGQMPGVYDGSLVVSGKNLPLTTVTLKLRVRNFALPSTPTLKSLFKLHADEVTRAHFGGQWCSDWGDATTELLLKYARAGTNHRISIANPYCGHPSTSNAAEWTKFDAAQGTLLDGSVTSWMNPHATVSAMSAVKSHFDAKGWTLAADGSARLLDYTCDEPPHFCDVAGFPTHAKNVHSAGLKNLVTTNYDYLKSKGWLGLVDIVVPVVETINAAEREKYEAFLALGPAKELWWYQSCDSHGCGGCSAGQASFDGYAGLPSYVIDTDARQHRSMEWLSFIYDMQGELYYETAMHLSKGLDWTSGLAYCDFGGNGDGALFYPGKPSDPRIGGPPGSDFPIESLRMKLIREGMEDYEYLRLFEQKTDRKTAVEKAKSVFPNVFGSKASDAATLYARRKEMADVIEGALTPPPPPPAAGAKQRLLVPRTTAPIDLTGDASDFELAPELVVAAGQATARFRLMWDQSHLYVAATVTDGDVRYSGSGEDGELWNADGVELMFDPMRTGGASPDADDRHVIVTAKGDRRDAIGAGSSENHAWDMAGLSHSASLESPGSFNDQSADIGYRIRVKIPWAELPLAAGQSVGAGLVIGLDLALNNLDAPGLAHADWAELSTFAQPHAWHEIELVDAAETSGVLHAVHAPPSFDLASDPGAFDRAPGLRVSTASASGVFRVLWDATHLYVAAQVSDSDLRFAGTGEDGALWNADGIEVMLDPKRTRSALPDADDRHVIVTAKGDKLDAIGAGSTEDASHDIIGLTFHAASTPPASFNDTSPDAGYRIAIAIPWSELALPSGESVGAGLSLVADLALDDLDASGLSYADWAGLQKFAQPSAWRELKLRD